MHLPLSIQIILSQGVVHAQAVPNRTFPPGNDADITPISGQGNSLEQALKGIVAAYRAQDEAAARHHHEGWTLGDTVSIRPPRAGRIKTSGGVPEGFPASIVGQIGTIIGFDPHTRSGMSVGIEVEGQRYWGHPSDIVADTAQGPSTTSA